MSKHRKPTPLHRRRIALRLGAASAGLVVVGAGWLAFAPEAGAVSAIQTGYWSALPAAPQVPAGGFEVGSNASGAHAVAAIRFTLAPGEVAETLTLKVAQAQPASQVAISACPVAARSSSWTPPSGGGPGAMSAAPAADCTGGIVIAELSSDGTTLSVNLSAMSFSSSTVDVLLQPSQVGTPGGGTIPQVPTESYPTFDASFQPVTADQIAVSGGSVTTVAPPPPAATGGGGTSGVVAPPPATSAPIEIPPATTTDTGGAAPVVAPSAQPTNAAVSAPTLLTKKRNLRLLFGIGMLSSDLLFAMLWLQHRLPTDERPPLSIYDPPPLAS